MNKFLIIINTHNNLYLLNKTLQSILSQNYQQSNYLVVVCDTSTIKIKRENSANLFYINIEDRLDMADNWNRSIKLATNIAKDLNFEFTFFGLFHDDDIYDTNILSIYNKKINKFNVDIIGSNRYIVGKPFLYNFYYDLVYNRNKQTLFEAGKNFYNEVARNWYNISTPSLMFSKEILKHDIKYNKLYGSAADVMYLLQLSEHYRLMIINEKLLGYRIHSNSTSNKTIKMLKLQQEKYIFKKIRENIRVENMNEYEDTVFLRRIMFLITKEEKKDKLIKLLKIVSSRINSSSKKQLLFLQIVKAIIKIIKGKK